MIEDIMSKRLHIIREHVVSIIEESMYTTGTNESESCTSRWSIREESKCFFSLSLDWYLCELAEFGEDISNIFIYLVIDTDIFGNIIDNF
jgi:hypothetical protein